MRHFLEEARAENGIVCAIVPQTVSPGPQLPRTTQNGNPGKLPAEKNHGPLRVSQTLGQTGFLGPRRSSFSAEHCQIESPANSGLGLSEARPPRGVVLLHDFW